MLFLCRSSFSGGWLRRPYTQAQSIPRKNSWALICGRSKRLSGSCSSSLSKMSLNLRLIKPTLLLILLSMSSLQMGKGPSLRMSVRLESSSWKRVSLKKSSNIRMPIDQMSAFWPKSPEQASGAMYSRVPTKVDIDFLFSTITFDRPQSVSFRWPQSVTSRFSGLSYLQIIPCWWRKPMLTTISATMVTIAYQVKKLSFLRRQQQRSPMERYSMTMQMLLLFWKVYLMATKNSSCPIFLIRSHCSRLNSFILFFYIIFIANFFPLLFYCTSTTHPNAPLPRQRRCWNSQGPRFFAYSLRPGFAAVFAGESTSLVQGTFFLGWFSGLRNVLSGKGVLCLKQGAIAELWRLILLTVRLLISDFSSQQLAMPMLFLITQAKKFLNYNPGKILKNSFPIFFCAFSPHIQKINSDSFQETDSFQDHKNADLK